MNKNIAFRCTETTTERTLSLKCCLVFFHEFYIVKKDDRYWVTQILKTFAYEKVHPLHKHKQRVFSTIAGRNLRILKTSNNIIGNSH